MCDSYDTAHWLGFSPPRMLSVTFADGSTPKRWAVASDFGGTAEVNANCSSYGGPFCTYRSAPRGCLARTRPWAGH